MPNIFFCDDFVVWQFSTQSFALVTRFFPSYEVQALDREESKDEFCVAGAATFNRENQTSQLQNCDT